MILICVIFAPTTHAQEFAKRIISYDLKSGQFDTLDAAQMITDKSYDSTPNMWTVSKREIVDLPDNIFSDYSSLVPSTLFSKPQVAAGKFDIQSYPVSTAVKLFNTTNGGQGDLCSGVMISDRHVLSSAHCIFQAYTTIVNIPDVEARIFYDTSIEESRTYSSKVNKIYFIEGWNISFGEDLAIYELEENIGVISGWMSIGYNDDDSFFDNRHMHKLAYPSFNTPFNDFPYNGDTLYYSHGNINFINDNFLGVKKHLSGVGGESGSPIFDHQKGEDCVAYGVLTWLGNYSHSRINKERYYAFVDVLDKNQVSTAVSDEFDDLSVQLFPNPATSELHLKFKDKPASGTIARIYDVQGRLVHDMEITDKHVLIDVNGFPIGTLFLHVSHNNRIVLTRPFIKY